MAVHTPDSWASLSEATIDLGDILGSPAIDPPQAATDAVGAFGRAVAIGPPSALRLVAERTPRPLSRTPTTRSDVRDRRDEAARAVSETLGAQVLRDVHVLTSFTGVHTVLQQQVDGCDVVGGRLLVHADDQGPFGISGHPVGDLAGRDPGQRPKRTPLKRIDEAIRARLDVAEDVVLESRPVLLPHDGDAEWAWFVRVPVQQPYADVHVFLSADARLEVRLMYPVSVSGFYGEGHAHVGNPLRNPDPVRVCLRDLGDDPAGGLQGVRLVVATREGSALVRPDRHFDVTVDEAAFDEVAAYHHVSGALDHFTRLFRPELFELGLFQPLQVIVNDPGSKGNAQFHSTRGEITLGKPTEDGASAARSADIVLHEVAHAVAHGVCKLPTAPDEETKGIGEGYSDYFACSALDDPRFGDYLKNEPDGARSCAKQDLWMDADDRKKERYATGEVWANVLWGIRAELGADITDLIVAESLYYAQTMVTVDEFASAVLTADAKLFPAGDGTRGRHADLIEQEVTARFM